MRLRFVFTTKALHGAFVVCAVAAVAVVATSALPWAHADVTLTSSETGTFRIRGKASGLYPGRTVSLPVTVVNRNYFPIVVRSVSVAVGSPSASCTGANVRVTSFRGSLRVRARRSRALTLKIRLLATAPNSCAGATFPLRYRGTAVKG